MKRLTFEVLSIMGILLGGCASSLAQEESALINKNGGFEEGKGFYHIVRPEACKVDTEEAYRGQNSMRISGLEEIDPKLEDPMVVAGYEISTPGEGDEYIFRCAVKTQGVNSSFPPRIELLASKKGAPGIKIPESKELIFKQDMDWTKFEIKITNLPKDCNVIGFWLRMPHQSGGAMWIDEIEIRKVTK